MEWWLFPIVISNCQALGRYINRDDYRIAAFSSQLRPNSEQLTDIVMKTIEATGEEFLYTTKTIVAPVLNHGITYVTFSLNSLDESDTVLYAKLLLPTFWAPSKYPFNYTSLNFEIENDYFIVLAHKTSENKGIITHEMRSPKRAFQFFLP